MLICKADKQMSWSKCDILSVVSRCENQPNCCHSDAFEAQNYIKKKHTRTQGQFNWLNAWMYAWMNLPGMKYSVIIYMGLSACMCARVCVQAVFHRNITTAPKWMNKYFLCISLTVQYTSCFRWNTLPPGNSHMLTLKSVWLDSAALAFKSLINKW